MPHDAAGYLYLLAALAAVLGLVGLAGLLARRAGFGTPPPAGRAMALEEVLPLGPRHRVYLLRIGRRRVALLLGGGTSLVLDRMDAPEAGP